MQAQGIHRKGIYKERAWICQIQGKFNSASCRHLHAKSIDTIALTAAAEGEFKIKLTPGEANRNTTIKKTVDCIVSKMRGRD